MTDRLMPANIKQTLEIVEHLIELFDLPPVITSLEITWDAASVMHIKCDSLPVPKTEWIENYRAEIARRRNENQ